jgi:hypothetical protein
MHVFYNNKIIKLNNEIINKKCSYLKLWGSWIYNYLMSPDPVHGEVLVDTTLCDQACQWLTAGQRFSPGTPASFTNKTDSQEIAEILLKVALNTKTTTLTPC